MKKTVERHGGEVRLRTEEGEGATFSFTWRSQPVSAEPSARQGP